MEFRQLQNITAIKNEQGQTLAFHNRNLEVAEISDEAWQALNQDQTQSEALEQLHDWNDEISDTTSTVQPSRQTRSLTLNVTQICNLACTYCAAGGDGTYGDPTTKIAIDKTLPQIEYFIRQLDSGNFHITFLGGEPLLYPEGIRAVGEYAQKLCEAKGLTASFRIITNATLITNQILDLLAPLKPAWTISLDGPKEINDQVRPQKDGKSATDAVIKGLKTLLTRRQEFGRILIHAVFNKSNLQLKEAYQFFSEFNPDQMEFTFDVLEKDAEINKQFIEKMSEVAASAFAKGGETELRKFTLFDNYFNALDQQTRTENYCGAGKSLLSLDAKGNIFTCPLEVSHPTERVGQGQSLNYGALEEYAKPLIELNNCQTCWARYLCGGGCMYNHKSLTGNRHQKDSSYCERTRSLLALTLMYYKQTRA